MLEKISRDICLIKHRKFPLRDFEKGHEISFYPNIHSHYWFKINQKELAKEITKLYRNLEVENLIFFGDYNRNWISKFTEERKDSKKLIESVNYFKEHRITKRFNGAVKVNIENLEEFIRYFYILTECDGGFAYYHFLDENENFLGFIHYSGEVRFDILNQKKEKILLEEIEKTKFVKKL